MFTSKEQIRILFLVRLLRERNLEERDERLDLFGGDLALSPQVKDHVDRHAGEGHEVGHEQGDVMLEDCIPSPNDRIGQANDDNGQIDVTRVTFANDRRNLAQSREVGRDGDR